MVEAKASKAFTVDPSVLRSFTRAEKIAVLKLLMKIASADNDVTDEEHAKIQEFLQMSNLKVSQEFWSTVKQEECITIVDAFTSKASVNRARKLIDHYADHHGVHPEFEGPMLEEIAQAIEAKKKTIKRDPTYWIRAFFQGFGFLWGQEDIQPTVKKVLAIVFTIVACVFGSLATSSFLGLFRKTFIAIPEFSAVLSGLLIYGALSVRKYMPRPTNIPNILIVFVDVYLLSLISMYILGRGTIEKTMTAMVFFGLIALLWLGMKEILGFFVVGVFILMIVKITFIDKQLAWRAYLFMIFTFMGLSFQSDNFFDDVENIFRTYTKTSVMEKELTKDGRGSL